MNDTMELLLTLQLQAMGYDAFEAVAGSIESIISSSKTLEVVAGTVTLAFAAMGAAAFGFIAAAETAGQFNTMTVEVANNANMTDKQLADMQATTLDLARNTGLATTDIAQGYMHIADEGFQAADATQVATAAAESAASTGANFNQVANLLATAMHDWHINGQDAATTMDTLHVAAALSNVPLQQFVAGMQSAAPVSALAGVSVDQAAAAIATLTREGYTATQAGTQFKNMITHIISPTSGAEKAIAALSERTGVDLVGDFTQAAFATKGFNAILGDIAKATGGDINAFADLTGEAHVTGDQLNYVTEAQHGNLQAMQSMIPATRGLYAEFILTSSGAQDYKKIIDAIAQAHLDGGVTAQNFARWEETLGAQMQILKANVQVAGVEIGERFVPYLTAAVQFVTNNVIPAIEVFANALGGAVVPMLRAAGNEFRNLVAAFQSGGLMAVLGQLGSQILSFAGTMFNAGVNLVEQLGAGMLEAAQTVVMGILNEIAGEIASFFVGMSPPPKGPLSKIDVGGKNTMTAWVGGAKQGLGGLQSVADSASYTLSSIGDKAKFTTLTNDATQAKLAVIGLKDAGADAAVSLAHAKDAVHGLSDDIGNVQANVDSIKTHFEGLIQPLQQSADSLKYDIQGIHDDYAALNDPLQVQLDDLKQSVDYTQQIADNAQQMALNQLNVNIATDEGDKVQKAQLENQLEAVRARANELDIEAQIKDIQGKKTAAAGDSDKTASLNAKLQELNIQKQIYDLQNHAQLATDQTAKVTLEQQIAAQKAKEQKEALEQKAKELGLEQQISKNKQDEAAKTLSDRQQLLKIQEQITKYKDDEAKALVDPQAELEKLKAIKQTLGDQVQALTTAKTEIGAAATKAGGLASQLGLAASAAKGIGSGIGGIGGGIGGGFKFPSAAPPNTGAGYNPSVWDNVASGAGKAMETATADAVGKAQAGAKKAVQAWLDGLKSSFSTKGKDVSDAMADAAKGIVPALMQALGNIKSAAPATGAALAAMFETAKPLVIAELTEMFNNAKSVLGPVFTSMFSAIGTALSKAIGPQNMATIKVLGDGFADFGTKLKPVADALGALGSTLKTSVGPAIATGVVPALKDFAKFLGDAFSAAVQLTNWFQQHQSALDAVKAVMLAIVGVGLVAVVTILITAIAAVAVATWAWAAAMTAVAVAFVIANAPIILIAAGVAALIFGIMELVRHLPEIAAFFSLLGTLAHTAVGLVGEAFSELGTLISATLATIGTTIGDFWDNVGTSLHDKVLIVKNTVGGFFDDLGTKVHGVVSGIVTFIQNYWPLAVAALLVIMGPIGWIILAVIKFREQIGTELGKVIGFWENLFSTVVGDAEGFIATTVQRWGDLWSQIGTLVDNGVSAISGKVTAFVTAVEGFISGLISNVELAWTAFWTTIGTAVDTAWIAISTKFGTGISNLITAVGNRISDIKAQIQALLDAAKAVVTADIHWWADLGKNIVDAMANGIKDAARAVADQAGAMVQGALNAAKGALGVKSPSTVFADIGKNVALGYIQGVSGMTGRVASATTDMLSLGSGGSVAGGGGGGVVININNPTLLNARDMQDFATMVGDTLVRRTGNAFSMVRS